MNKSRYSILSFRTSNIICLLMYFSLQMTISSAQESNSNVFDMSSLANIATSLTSNPQIMGLFSTLMNQKPANQNQAQSSDSSRLPEIDSIQDGPPLIPNQPTISQTTSEPIKRNNRFQVEPMSVEQPTNNLNPSKSSPYSGLMSLASTVLPNVNLNGLMGMLANPKPSVPKQELPATNGTSQPQASVTAQSNPTSTAQSVVNQVLTAYANGQIPPELIQLGLSGRVPPSIIDLALSGQVPNQIIQMVITGQVPISTINAFLNSLPPQQQQQQSSLQMAEDSSKLGARQSTGVFSTTRTFFETLLGSKSPNGQGFTIPTLFGPVQIQRPSVRRMGQIFGEGISTVASLIPF